MLWEAEPAVEIARKLEDSGVQMVVFSPCGNTPDNGDYFTVMQQDIKYLGIPLSSIH